MATNLSKFVWIFLWSCVAFLPLIWPQDVCRWNWVQFRENNGQWRIFGAVPPLYLCHNLVLILLGFQSSFKIAFITWRCHQLVVVSCVSISKVCFVQERNWTGKELQRCPFCQYSTSVGAWWLPYQWVSYDLKHNHQYHSHWTQVRSLLLFFCSSVFCLYG